METVGPFEALVAILVPLGVVFTVIVLPIWLILHYVSKRKREHPVVQNSSASTHELDALAAKLEKRVQSLETILDAEVPGWRKQHMDRRDS